MGNRGEAMWLCGDANQGPEGSAQAKNGCCSVWLRVVPESSALFSRPVGTVAPACRWPPVRGKTVDLPAGGHL